MRRLAAGLMATSVLAASAASATAASEVDAAIRVAEIPGTGLAVRLPADWRVWSPPATIDPVVIASDVAARQDCTFSLVEGATSAREAARETQETIDAHKQLELVARDVLTVSSRDAVRVSCRYGFAPDEPRFVHHEYYITGPDGVASVFCSSADPPADRWYSIVDALEGVEAADQPSAPFDPRVEVPDHGFAIDFAAEWLAKAWPGPGPLFGWSEVDDGSPAIPTAVLRAMTATDEPSNAECFFEDVTGLPGLPDADSTAEWQATFTISAGPRRGQASTPSVTTVNLASGTAVRADWERCRDMPASAWVFFDGVRRIVLFCRAEEPPADSWRSIADTFEFLPLRD